MISVWSCLYTSYHGVLESGGDNNYPRHRGFRSAEDEAKLQKVPRRVLKSADKCLADLQKLDDAHNADAAANDTSESEDNSSDESD